MMLLLKKRQFILLFGLLLVCLSACLRDNELDNYPMNDAEILFFSLSSDSIPALTSTIFTINQNVNGDGFIYNRDSLPFGTVFEHKVTVSYSNDYGTNSMQHLYKTESGNDTIVWVSGSDSLDISPLELTFRSFPYDNDTTRIKKYTLKINIHQIDPDSIQYIKIVDNLDFLKTEELKAVIFNDKYYVFSKESGAVELFSSNDVVSWQTESLTGLPANTVVRDIQIYGNKGYAVTEDGKLFVADGNLNNWTEQPQSKGQILNVLGYLETVGLCAVLQRDDILIFGHTKNLADWETGYAVPDNFPVRDIYTFNREYMNKGTLTVIGGISANNTPLKTVWSTQDGLYWAHLNTIATGPIYSLIRPNIYDYDGKFMIINGVTLPPDNIWREPLYTSVDGGVTWNIETEKEQRYKIYTERKGAASLVSSDGKYGYFLGGQDKNGNYLSEIWKFFINKMEFPKDE